MKVPSVFPHADLETLLDAFLRAMEDDGVTRGREAAKPIPVVVPSIQFTDWFQVAIARRKGLCMGYDFIMPQAFMERVLAIADGPGKQGENLWSKRNLVWHLLPHIPQYAARLGVTDPSPRDRLALAGLLAEQFDQYAHFRPEFVETWNAGRSVARSKWTRTDKDNEEWQRELWTRLSHDLQAEDQESVHPCLRVEKLMQSGGFHKSLNIAFPKLFVVGSGTLDPLLVRVLGLLSEADCDVEIHVVLPSLSYLGELRKAPPATNQDPEAIEMHSGHPLLVSMGRHAVGSFLLLGKLDENYSRWPDVAVSEEEPLGPTLLSRLQTDIRALRLPICSHELANHDVSVRVHSCFGPRREMEVLRDELFRAFQDIKDLKPDEVMVVTPSLEVYAPFVAAVLEQEPPLPVRLTELPPAEQDAVAEGLLALLEMVRGHGEASALLELLHQRAVRACLGISENAEAVDRLRDWVRHSGLTRESEQGHPDGLGSWRFARDRLIAGNWFGDAMSAVYPAGDFALPISEDLGNDVELRHAFLKWHWVLGRTLNEWKSAATAADWSHRLSNACDLLLSAEGDADARVGVQQALGFLSCVRCDALLDAAAIFDWLQGEFAESSRRTLLSGRITFGKFKQLQNLPCRVLAMVGMQDGAFPRQSRVPAWDLLRRDPRSWDRNARIDDRQLFLDALMAPKERLIITASTRNVRSGNIEPFSSCVDEMLRVAEATMRNKKSLVVQHRLQPFAEGYFRADGGGLPLSFDSGSARVADAVLKGESGKRKGIPFWATAPSTRAVVVEEPVELTVDQLIQFWKDPAKTFLRAQGIVLAADGADDEALDRFPLQLGGLDAWHVKDATVADVIEQGAPSALTKALLRADRKLPPAQLGDLAWLMVGRQVEPLGLKVREVKVGHIDIRCNVTRSPIVVRITGTMLEGILNGEHVWLSYRVGAFNKARHFLAPWIAAIVASAAGQCRRTCTIGDTDPDAPQLLRAYALSEAELLLRSLVEGLLEGRHRPLCYAPMASDAYVQKFTSKNGPWATEADEEALAAASGRWESGGFNSNDAEGDTATARLAWRDQDPFAFGAEWHRWAQEVANPLRNWCDSK